MTSFTTGTEMGGFSTVAKSLSAVSRVLILAGALIAIAGMSHAADSISPPNQNDVAVLRGLLALQHPALRQAGASIHAVPAAVAPAVTTEPGQQQHNAVPATDGEAGAAPRATGDATCGPELDGSFRVSLVRAFSTAGLRSEKL